MKKIIVNWELFRIVWFMLLIRIIVVNVKMDITWVLILMVIKYVLKVLKLKVVPFIITKLKISVKLVKMNIIYFHRILIVSK